MGMPRLWAGASGYAYKEWQGSFYPEKISPEAMKVVLNRSPARIFR